MPLVRHGHHGRSLLGDDVSHTAIGVPEDNSVFEGEVSTPMN